MDPFFTWIETTELSIWLRESPSLWAFPFVLILHTVGLAFLVGANVALDARVLGLAADVPPTTLRRYDVVMWAGFWVNAVSGVLLLIAYPTKALTNPLFYGKLASSPWASCWRSVFVVRFTAPQTGPPASPLSPARSPARRWRAG